jgi:hypothetical protein
MPPVHFAPVISNLLLRLASDQDSLSLPSS